MKIGIISNSSPKNGDLNKQISAAFNSLEQAGLSPILFDPTVGDDDPNPGRRSLNAQQWKQRLYRRHREVEILHCYTQNWADLGWFGSTAKALNKATIATIYDPELLQSAHTPRNRQALQSALTNIGRFVAQTPLIATGLIELGCPTEKICQISRLDPTSSPPDRPPLPKDLATFVQNADQLLLMTGEVGFHRTFDKSGLDIVIEAIALLHRRQHKVQLVALIENPDSLSTEEARHMELLKQRIPQAKLMDAVYWSTNNTIDLHDLFPHAKAFIRATNFSEDSPALHLAINNHLPAIASDSCPRPPATILFQHRNALDLARTIEEVLAGKQEAIVQIDKQVAGPSLLELYRELLAT